MGCGWLEEKEGLKTLTTRGVFSFLLQLPSRTKYATPGGIIPVGEKPPMPSGGETPMPAYPMRVCFLSCDYYIFDVCKCIACVNIFLCFYCEF